MTPIEDSAPITQPVRAAGVRDAMPHIKVAFRGIHVEEHFGRCRHNDVRVELHVCHDGTDHWLRLDVRMTIPRFRPEGERRGSECPMRNEGSEKIHTTDKKWVTATEWLPNINNAGRARSLLPHVRRAPTSSRLTNRPAMLRIPHRW